MSAGMLVTWLQVGGWSIPWLVLAEQKLDRVLRDKQSLDKQRQDRLISSVSQTLTTAVNTKLDKVVKSEMKNNVLPGEWMEESLRASIIAELPLGCLV